MKLEEFIEMFKIFLKVRGNCIYFEGFIFFSINVCVFLFIYIKKNCLD